MLFCDDCGTLKSRKRDGHRICPRCDEGKPERIARRANTKFERVERGHIPDPRPIEPGDQRIKASPTPAAGPSMTTPSSTGAATAQVATDGPRPHPFFPFPEARPGQVGFLDDVGSAIEDGNIVVAQVPTGLGKTAGVLAPAVKAALETGKRIFFLTPKQSQHKVVIDTLNMIRSISGSRIVVSDMISKQAMCPRAESERMGGLAFTEFCSEEMRKGRCRYYEADHTDAISKLRSRIYHVEDAVEMCTDHGVCPHKALIETGKKAHVVVLDYNHFFSDMVEGTLDRFDLSLDNAVLIIDEAHNLPERIRDHLTWRLSPNALIDAAREARKRSNQPLAGFLEALANKVTEFATSEKEINTRDLTGMMQDVAKRTFPLEPPSPLEVVEQLEEVADKVEAKGDNVSVAREVADFLRKFPTNVKGVFRATDPDTQSIIYRVLDAAYLSRNIFDGVHAAVLMSGTMYPMEMYAQILGVPDDRLITRAYDNPFPAENRRVVADANVSSAYRERSPQMYDDIADRIQRVADATPGNVAAFFPSYAILDEIASRLDGTFGRSILLEDRRMDKDGRERLVGRVVQAGGRALLLGVQGGSLSEGYDFVHDDSNLFRSVVIVGVPYAPPSLESRALQQFYEDSFGSSRGRLYNVVAPAARRMLQAAGRGIRAPHHTAFVALLDHRFGKAPLTRCYPPDFQPRTVQDVGLECESFFRRVGN